MGCKWHNRALLKMLMTEPHHQPGILYDPNKYFLAGNSSEFQGFLESSAPDTGKTLFRQKYSRPGRVNTLIKIELTCRTDGSSPIEMKNNWGPERCQPMGLETASK
jgi:hypothetical protein